MSFSVASMETPSSIDVQYLDSAWEQRTAETAQSTVQTPPHPPQGKTYASYASAATSDQVSGMTEPDAPRDDRHDELNKKIATLEAMVVQLCQQVQRLTNYSDQQQTFFSNHEDNNAMHPGKRQDLKETPRKHKKALQYSTPSIVAEDINEPAPMNDDRLTAWDDYLPEQKDGQM